MNVNVNVNVNGNVNVTERKREQWKRETARLRRRLATVSRLDSPRLKNVQVKTQSFFLFVSVSFFEAGARIAGFAKRSHDCLSAHAPAAGTSKARRASRPAGSRRARGPTVM